MRVGQLAAVSAFVMFGVVALAVPTVGLSTDFVTETGQEADTDTEEGLGTQVSSFAQASATDTRSSVDSGMWQTGLNESNPAPDVQQRADQLEQRLEQLENRVDQLEENEQTPTYTARASGLRAEMANVQTAIEEVNETANQHGVNVTELNQLRSQAANMTGPEVAEQARAIIDTPRGPPAHAGPGNETGPPEDAGPENGEAGPPEDTDQAANETDQSGETGPEENETEDSPGQGTSPPDSTGL